MIVTTHCITIQLIYTKYRHYVITMIVLTIVINACSRIVMPENLTIAHPGVEHLKRMGPGMMIIYFG